LTETTRAILQHPKVDGVGRAEDVTRLGSRMLWVGTAATALLMWMVVWRPIAVAPVHNLTVGIALVVAALALVSASVEVKTVTGWFLVGINALLIGFLVRAVPAFVLGYAPLHDGYFYLVSLLNVTQAGTLEPAYATWYGQVGQQLDWPVLQLVTAQVASWSGVAPADLARYLPAAFGSLTYFAVGLLAYSAFPSWRVAALAGVLGGFTDSVLFFQGGYQPQGLAILVLLYFLFLLVVSRTAPSIRTRFLMLLVGAAFLFTHHASTLVLPVLVGPLLILPIVAGLMLSVGRAGEATGRRDRVVKVLAALAEYRSVAVLLVVGTLALHLYYYDAIVRFILTAVDPSALLSAANSTSTPPELWLSALRWAKYLVLVMGLVGILRSLRSPTANPVLLVVLALGLMAGTLVSLAALPAAAFRFFALMMPVAAIFAAYALIGGDQTAARGQKVLRSGALTLAAVCVAAGIANAQQSSVAYLFADPPRSAEAWYGGALPRTDLMALAGQWLGKTDSPDRIYAVDFSTRMAPFFYGHISDAREIFGGQDPNSFCQANVLVVDYQLTAEQLMEPRLTFNPSNFDRVYDNGSIAVFLRRTLGCQT
jgi:hypothetical protein